MRPVNVLECKQRERNHECPYFLKISCGWPRISTMLTGRHDPCNVRLRRRLAVYSRPAKMVFTVECSTLFRCQQMVERFNAKRPECPGASVPRTSNKSLVHSLSVRVPIMAQRIDPAEDPPMTRGMSRLSISVRTTPT
jgi:hypothetical protein